MVQLVQPYTPMQLQAAPYCTVLDTRNQAVTPFFSDESASPVHLPSLSAVIRTPQELASDPKGALDCSQVSCPVSRLPRVASSHVRRLRLRWFWSRTRGERGQTGRPVRVRHGSALVRDSVASIHHE